MQEPLKIILVGNSDGVLKQKWGSEIDKFDIVVRFNNMVIKRYEKFVGKKTTYVFLSRSFVNKTRNVPKDSTVLFMKKHVETKLVRKFPPKWELAESFSSNYGKNKVYSSGVRMSNHFRSRYPDSTIVMYGMCDGGISHYFQKTFKVFHKHDFSEDLKKIKEYGVIPLADYLNK